MITCTRIDTPLGPLLASAEDHALTGLWFIGQRHFPAGADDWPESPGERVFGLVREQIADYFAGTRRAFDLPLAPGGSRATAFQRSVWSAIARVPFGETGTYASLAAQCGNPAAARAAGAATGRNPISIVIPCHRIIGTSGALTGYAGGLERKRKLLQLEAPH